MHHIIAHSALPAALKSEAQRLLIQTIRDCRSSGAQITQNTITRLAKASVNWVLDPSPTPLDCE